MFWVDFGRATEANPLLENLLAENPLAFVATKFVLVALGTILLWRHRDRALAQVATPVVFTCYLGVCLLHLHGATLGLP